MAHGTYDNPRAGSNGSKNRMKKLTDKTERVVTKTPLMSEGTKQVDVYKDGKKVKRKTKYKASEKGDVKKTVVTNPSEGVYVTKTKRKGEKATTKTYGA